MKEDKKNTTSLPKTAAPLLVVAIFVGAISFFAGMKYQETKQPRFFGGMNGQMMQRGQTGRTGNGSAGAMRNGFRPVSGEIISFDDKSITVKLQDGSSKIVIVAETTDINKADKASKDQLKPGETVVVFGQENSDGSITAQNIQLNPIIRVPGATSPTPTK